MIDMSNLLELTSVLLHYFDTNIVVSGAGNTPVNKPTDTVLATTRLVADAGIAPN